MDKKFHGKKRYFQVLLDPARAELVDDLAEQLDVRPTSLIRDMVYAYLERTYAAEVYVEAASKDRR